MLTLMLGNFVLKAALLLFFPYLAACSPGDESGKKEKQDSSYEHKAHVLDTAKRIADYKALCGRMETKRQSFASAYKAAAASEKKAVLEKARKYLDKTLVDSLFVYWYDTPWDFNGVSQEPLKGQIACGYFVTTTLKQCGFQINRVSMAQCASSQLIKATCEKEKIKIITNGQLEKVKTYLASQPDGIYIVGLDIHVGYIVKRGKELDMVHSSYWPQRKVVREKFAESLIILENKYFMIGNLLGSESTVKAWVEHTAIE
ncbi:MAG: hypothetical protein FD123_3671 [Bacteroidetes bacterium]|nr:MAG: hypothetical protein FD123_3671 [Bacteroidota bacterium]